MIDPNRFLARPRDVESPPARGWRDHVNRLRLDAKFLWPPGRAYYKRRARKYVEYKTPEIGMLRYLADPLRAAVDVGANLGLVCRVLSPHVREVFAFEPNPYPLRYLSRVADANVRVLRAAASDATGEVAFAVPRTPRGWSSNGGRLDGDQFADAWRVRAPAVRLDDLDLPPIGLLKIDVEGAEIRVLRGALGLIARDRPALFVENELAQAGDDARAVFDLIADQGYDGFSLTPRGLRRFTAIDDPLDQGGLVHGDAGYVKNFMFLPR